MSKGIKLITIFISILLILGIIIFTYAFFDSRNNNQTVSESIRNLFPTSNNANTNPNLEGDTLPTNPGDVIDTIPNSPNKLTQISSEPTSGGMFSSTSSVRYIEKATGNVYEYSYFTGTARKITNTTIPKIYDSHWIDKDTFVARYLSNDNTTIKSFIGSITNPGDQGVINTVFLRDNITGISINSGEVFYIVDSFPGSTGFIYNTKTNQSTLIFTSDISELTPLWNNDRPLVYTNPSHSINGTLFGVRNGVLFEILSDIAGMLASSINNKVLVSSFSLRNNTLSYNIDTGESQNFVNTLIPEKCVQLSENLYCALSLIPQNFPDSWYRGENQFNDHIYRIENNKGRVLVYDFKEEIPNGIDVVNISISPDGEQILFMNKRDNSLWSLDLSQN